MLIESECIDGSEEKVPLRNLSLLQSDLGRADL